MLYHIVAKYCKKKPNCIGNNNFCIIGSNNAERHYEETIPSAQEQTYDTI